MKQAKFKNTKTEYQGIKFDSIKERDRYISLRSMLERGEIKNLELQKPFVLAPSVTLKGRNKPALRYFADFCYEENGVVVVEDVKSVFTRTLPAWRIKAHLMMAMHGIEVKEV